MAEFNKINYFDLKHEQTNLRLPSFFGREKEILRLSRIVLRSEQNSVIVTGPSGLGKSAFVRGWASLEAKSKNFTELPFVELSVNSLILANSAQAALNRFREALASINKGVVIIDGFGHLTGYQVSAFQTWVYLLQPLLDKPKVHLVLTMETKELEWLTSQSQSFVRNFDIINLEPQPDNEIELILKEAAKNFSKIHSVNIESGAITSIIKFCRQFPVLGELPGAGIRLLDECAAQAKYLPAFRTLIKPGVNQEIITKIVSEKTAVPVSNLSANEKDTLKNLLPALQQSVIGQTPALSNITSVIQRAKLGLKNNARPLGSFMMLGPSGVGKTETAKVLAQQIFGKPSAFLRIDMSEFAESHTVSRLIGSPPGYLGSDAGGQLTNHLKAQPHSLILLDEIEKAHPKIFDIFLQILDDGRLTSGRGETVDANHSIIMATSNLGIEEIVHFNKSRDILDPLFLEEILMPILRQNFRTEFLNRFDNILVYQPLTVDALTDIGLLEIKKIEQRVKQHNISFSITRENLRKKVETLADPRLGARPVKRFVEELCEGLVTKKLLG